MSKESNDVPPNNNNNNNNINENESPTERRDKKMTYDLMSMARPATGHGLPKL